VAKIQTEDTHAHLRYVVLLRSDWFTRLGVGLDAAVQSSTGESCVLLQRI